MYLGSDFTFENALANAPVAHDDGHFISAEVSRIVELVREYDSRLDVKWIPPELRRPGDAAFSVIERASDGKEYVVFHVDKEEEFNASVLTRLYLADVEQNDVQGRIEAGNKAIRNAQARKERDLKEEQRDLLASTLASPLHTYRHNGKTFRK